MDPIRESFRILEIAPDASHEEVRRAYRDLAQVWHPDRFSDKPRLRERAEERLKAINRAYAMLESHYAQRPDGAATSDSESAASAPKSLAEPRRLVRVLRQVAATAGRRSTLAIGLMLALAALAGAGLALFSNEPGIRWIESEAGQVLDFVHIAPGPRQACGVTLQQHTYCWGLHYVGESSHPGEARCRTETGDPVPCAARPRRIPTSEPLVTVVHGFDHACGLSSDGKAWCWGAGFLGQLGDGSRAERSLPQPVTGGLRFVSLTAFGQHTCGLTVDGKAFCWGSNADGQLGRGETAGATCPVGGRLVRCSTRPVEVRTVFRWNTIAAGGSHTCGISEAGSVWCWGSNRAGQLGVRLAATCKDEDGAYACSAVPVPVGTELSFQQVTAGLSHTCGITFAGQAHCWGSNDFGQLGDGSVERRESPVAVARALAIREIAAGGVHTCAVSEDEQTYCWGRNAFGELGTSAVQDCDGVACAREPLLLARRYAYVRAGGGFTCGTLEGGKSTCWGRNDAAQLGSGIYPHGSSAASASRSAEVFVTRMRAAPRMIWAGVVDLGRVLARLIFRIVRALDSA